MASVVVTDVEVLNPRAKFDENLQFQITFEVVAPGIENCLEWKVIYVGDSDNSELDQELEAVEVGPCPVGKCKFVLEAPPPNADQIDKKNLLDVTVLLLTCSYNSKEFLRVGYYVKNEHPNYTTDDDGEVSSSEGVVGAFKAQDCTRVINIERPTVTRFHIPWDNDDTDAVSLKRKAEQESDAAPDAKRRKTDGSTDEASPSPDATDADAEMDGEKTVVDISSETITGRILYNAPALDIVVDPYLVGPPLEVKAKAATADFLRTMDLQNLQGPLVILNILNGGKYYYLEEAWQEVGAGVPVEVCSVQCKRNRDSTGRWSCKLAEVSPNVRKAIAGAGTVIIGDTIATGSTLKAVIGWMLDVRAEELKGQDDDGMDVVIWTICGSDACLEALVPAGKRCIKAGGSLDINFANAQFKLDANGTDLSFVGMYAHPDAETAIAAKLGAFDHALMKCAIWDWGDRFTKTEHHVKELNEYFESKTFEGKELPKCFSKP